MKLFLSMIIACLLTVLSIGCSHTNPVTARGNDWLPSTFAEADSLYNALGMTMSETSPDFHCTNCQSLISWIVILGKTAGGKIANVVIHNGSKVVLHDSVGVDDAYGIDVLENIYSYPIDIVIVFGDKDYMGNATLRRLIVNGEIVNGIYPFGEAKIFSKDKIISYEYVSSGPMPGVSIKRYVVYDTASKTIVSQLDQQ